MPAKPTFQNLRSQHHFDIAWMASHADVDTSVVIAMLRGIPVYRSQAEKILAVYRKYTSTTYTLQNVDVQIFPERHEVGQ